MRSIELGCFRLHLGLFGKLSRRGVHWLGFMAFGLAV